MIIIMRYGENNVLETIYLDISISRVHEGGYIVHLTFFVYYSEKRTTFKRMTNTKIEFYIILIKNNLS